jgi:GMP synthase-like glutamine amidotransferase
MKILGLQHSALPAQTFIADWARRQGHTWAAALVPAQGAFPDPQELDCVIVQGGPMSVWEEARFPWLRDEKRYLDQLVQAGVPVLGICLGAQLLAEVLGARAYPGAQREIGWFPVETATAGLPTWMMQTLPPTIETFLWHGDTFDLPAGATRIARSAAFANQGFSWGPVMALQFHLEVRPQWVQAIVQRDAAQLAGSRFVQSPDVILSKPESLYRQNNALFETLIERWLEHCDAARARQSARS